MDQLLLFSQSIRKLILPGNGVQYRIPGYGLGAGKNRDEPESYQSMTKTFDPSDAAMVAGAMSRGELGQSVGPILVIERDHAERSRLKRLLEGAGFLVEAVPGVDRAEALRERSEFALVLVDFGQGDGAMPAWVERFLRGEEGAAVIAHGDASHGDSPIAAIRAGASDFLPRPVSEGQLLEMVRRHLSGLPGRKGNSALASGSSPGRCIDDLVGRSPAIRGLYEILRRVAPTASTILIEGESGTGKEVIARCIHRASKRRGQFVPVNCGAIPEDLLESELFGHVRGAFTGAQGSREGLFVYASGGTLFLDEIGEMPLGMQARLLRVLEEGCVRPVGSDRPVPVDVRILAATNRMLSTEIERGRMREDLYYRLNVLTLSVPPLRDRREDIEELAGYFVGKLGRELGLPAVELDTAELERLATHSWPGNVRELRNAVERSLLLGLKPSECLSQASLSDVVSSQPSPPAVDYSKDLPLAAVEKRHILAVLEAADGNKSEAARRLEISRKTLERKLKQWSEIE